MALTVNLVTSPQEDGENLETLELPGRWSIDVTLTGDRALCMLLDDLGVTHVNRVADEDGPAVLRTLIDFKGALYDVTND